MLSPFEEGRAAPLDRPHDLWSIRPDVLELLTLSAVEDDEISAEHAAEILGATKPITKQQLVVVSDGSRAELADTGLPIWEIVRVYRRLGSFKRTRQALVNITDDALRTALEYALENPDEIDSQIERYERAVARRAGS